MIKFLLKRFAGLDKGRSSSDVNHQTSSFLDKKAIFDLQPIVDDLKNFHPELKNLLQGSNGVRAWEYGEMLKSLPTLKGKKMLDIGSGPSLLPLYLSRKKGAQVTVLDLPQPYTIGYEQLLSRLLKENIVLKTGDMRNIPFEDNSFNFVISISVIEHLSHSADHKVLTPTKAFIEDTQKVLAEMYRVLCPGGWLYLTSDAFVSGRVKRDMWTRKFLTGDPYGAYSIYELQEVFIKPLSELGALFPFPIDYDASKLISSSRYSSYRNRYMTVFNLFVQKPELV